MSVWDVIHDPRTDTMRAADDEVDRDFPDEPDPVDRMRQEIIALVDLWTAARVSLTNAPEESCPACHAAWRHATRKATAAVVTPGPSVKPVVLPPAPVSLTLAVAAVQALTESDRLRLAVGTVATEVQQMAHGDGRGRPSRSRRRRLLRLQHELEALRRLMAP